MITYNGRPSSVCWMKTDRWQSSAKLLLIGAVLAFAAAWFGYAHCVYAVSDGMVRELNPLTERELGAQITAALAGVEAAPAGFGARASLAHPVCIKAHGAGHNAIWYALFGFLLIGAAFCRYQAKLVSERRIPINRTPGRELGVRTTPVPTAIDVGGDAMAGLSDKDREILEAVGSVNTRDESLMLYLTRKTEEADAAEQERPVHDIDGYFCPPGFHDKPYIYIDPGHVAASDELAGEDPVGNASRPFATLNGGIAMARKLLEEGASGVMLRVMPGVYHTSLELPSKVVICNHQMPLDGTPRDRLTWLTQQTSESEDAVTLLTPANAQCAVRLEPGVQQGIFGCHLVGREAVKQAGIVAVNCRAVALFNCSLERFTGGALRLQDSGTELAGGAVMLLGCRLHRNEAKLGAAIFAERSSVALSDCVVEHNRALTGGAIFSKDSRAPLLLTGTRIAHNRAQLDDAPEIDVDTTPLEEWQNTDGLGGGLYLLNSKLKAVGAAFVENGASVAGGGVAALNSRVVLELDGESPTRFARNRSRLGGGLAVIGWPRRDEGKDKRPDARATVKCADVVFERNQAVIAGGGLFALGIATVQLFAGEVRKNEVSAEDGFGAGGAAWLGGELLVSGTNIAENRAKGHGGGLAAVNAQIALKNEVVIEANLAGGAGGGIFAITTAGPVIRALIDNRQLRIPFAITMEGTQLRNNVAVEQGGGLRGGNMLHVATLPIGFKVAEDVVFQLNRTKSAQDNGDDVWITWASKVKGTDRERPEKLVLR